MGSSAGTMKLNVPFAKPGWGKLDVVNRQFVEAALGGSAAPAEYLSTDGGDMTGNISFVSVDANPDIPPKRWILSAGATAGLFSIANADDTTGVVTPSMTFGPYEIGMWARLSIHSGSDTPNAITMLWPDFSAGGIASVWSPEWSIDMGATNLIIGAASGSKAITIDRQTAAVDFAVAPTIAGVPMVAAAAESATQSVIDALNRRIEALEAIVARLTEPNPPANPPASSQF